MSETTIRPLTASDLEAVVALDRAVHGESRRGFFDKRLAAQLRNPDAFIALGACHGDRLDGFALAHLLDGEFGGRGTVAVLDALSVSGEQRSRGIGHALVDGLTAAARRLGAVELQTQAGWDEPALLGFFSAVGFELAPRRVLERAATRADF